MRASTVLGLTAVTLVTAADDDIFESITLGCFENADSGCAKALELVDKCSSRDAKPEDSIECACPNYFTANSECNKCMFEAAKKLEKENPEAAEKFRSYVPYSVSDSYETSGEMIDAHEEKLCKQGKNPKLNFAKALDEVADEFLEKYGDENDMTVTMSETTSASAAASDDWATATAPDVSSVSETTVTISESGSAKATVSISQTFGTPSATPTGDNNEEDGDDKKEGEEEGGEEEDGEDGEEKVPESGAASLVPAGIMVLAAGSALLALF